MRRRHLPVALALAVLLAVPGTAWAHTAVLEQAAASDAPWKAPSGIGPARLFPGAQDIPDPRVSRAVYGTLATGELFDAYRFEGPTEVGAKALTIPVEVLVPAANINAALRPTIAIIGFGEPAVGAGLPSDVLEHLKAVQATVPVTVARDPGAEPRATEYEPFVGEQLWRGASTEVTLEPGKTYYLLVYDSTGATGEYRLAVGEAERFTFADVLATPLAILRIKLGLYGQDPFDWGFAGVLALVAAAAAALVTWLVSLRRRRRARAASPSTP